MGRWAQRHRDTESLEERRLNGLALLRSGLSQAEVARRLVVTPAAVSLWKIATDQNGMAALRAVPRSGRPTLVPRDRLAALPDLLAKGALAYGFSTDLWTIPRIIQVTEAEWAYDTPTARCGACSSATASPRQRPRRQARETNSLRAVKNWRHRWWPRYKKARRRRAVVVFVDVEWVLAHPLRREDVGSRRPHTCHSPSGTVARVLGHQWHHSGGAFVLNLHKSSTRALRSSSSRST